MLVWYIYQRYIAPRLARHERAVAPQGPMADEPNIVSTQRARGMEQTGYSLP